MKENPPPSETLIIISTPSVIAYLYIPNEKVIFAWQTCGSPKSNRLVFLMEESETKANTLFSSTKHPSGPVSSLFLQNLLLSEMPKFTSQQKLLGTHESSTAFTHILHSPGSSPLAQELQLSTEYSAPAWAVPEEYLSPSLQVSILATPAMVY